MPRLTLRIKFLGGTMGIVVLLGLCIVLFVKTALSQKLFVKLQQRGVSIARNIATSSVNPILTEKFFELEMMVKDFRNSEDDIKYVFIMNEHGEVLAHTFENGFPVALKSVNSTPPNGEYSATRMATEGGGILDIAVPLLNGRIGAAHLGISEESVRRDVNDIIGLITWIIAAVLVVGSGLAVAFSEAMTRPILQLVAAAKAVGEGDLDRRIEIRSRDEIGELGKTFDAMIAMRKRALWALQKSEEEYRSLVESTEDSIYLVDSDCRYLFVNKMHLSRLSFPAEQVLGRPYADFHSTEEAAQFAASVKKVLGTGRSMRHEHLSRRDNRFFLRTLSPVKERDGRISAVTVVSKDITDLKRMEERLRTLSLTDELTGLYNRRGFFALAEQVLKVAKRQQKKLFVLYADLDNLKGINDARGHQEGDQALIDTAEIFRATYRESDIIARMGGDEFVVIAEMGGGDSGTVTARLQENIDDRNERGYRLSISCGLSFYDPASPRSIDELLAEADGLLYNQKKQRRGV